MKKEALIKLTKGQTFAFEIHEQVVSDTFFAAATFTVNHGKSLYLEIKHEQLNTSIDLTDLKDTLVLHFDDNDLMLGATYVLPKSSGSFGIITQSKRLLFLTFPIAFSPDEVKSVTIATGDN